MSHRPQSLIAMAICLSALGLTACGPMYVYDAGQDGYARDYYPPSGYGYTRPPVYVQRTTVVAPRVVTLEEHVVAAPHPHHRAERRSDHDDKDKDHQGRRHRDDR